MKRALTIALMAVIAAIAYACGGGGGDETQPDQPTPAVDCKAKPEQCK